MNDGEVIEIAFSHRQSAHCETGVLSNLLSHHGLQVSEAMVFGIGAGLFFGYFPFVRLNNLPLTAYRIATGGIMKRAAKRLGIRLQWEKFKNAPEAMDALDRKLEAGIPVGCRTGAYWLSYFPRRYRFHFNMHNVVAIGKNNGSYRISDPVLPDPVDCPAEDLAKARFAKGLMAPKGRMYHVTDMPENVDIETGMRKGIKEVCRSMLRVPAPFIGTKGIRYLAKKIEQWPRKLDDRSVALHLGQIIRMQEEIGTGGAGFRFIYAAFLQEAAPILDRPELIDLSAQMTEIGDRWRDFAVLGSRICKKRASERESYAALSDILRTCADQEESLFRKLDGLVRR